MKRNTRRWLLAALVCLSCAGVAIGEAADAEHELKTGLLWNRTGLPAVFPLLIDSGEGQDYDVLLRDAHSGTGALAAGLRGGTPLRLLVPPGEYRISFWKRGSLHGGDARRGPPELTLDRVLRFALSGANLKSGHRIDISPARDGTVMATTRPITRSDRRSAVASVRRVAPDMPERDIDPVGEQILKRRFERGMPVDQLYDRQRQQRDYDPPVLGLPQVPLARPKTTRIPWISPPQ